MKPSDGEIPVSPPVPSDNLGLNQEPSLPRPKPPPEHNWLIAGLFLLFILAAAASAYFLIKPKAADTVRPNQTTKLTIRLNWLNQAQFAGEDVALEKGFYKNAGLDVTIKPYSDGVNGNQELADGKADFYTGTPLEVLKALDEGLKIKAVAAIYQTTPYAIASRAEANIKTPADFKGKVLGNVGNNAEANTLYPALLTSYGIDLSQASIKGIDFDIVKDFNDKAADTADIYRTDQTYVLDKAGVKYNLLYPEQFGFNVYGDLLITSDKHIRQNPEIVKKFVQATLDGWRYALDHQEEALTLVAKHQDASYADPAYEKHILSTSAPLIKPSAGAPLGSMEFTPWNRAYVSAKTSNQLKTRFDANDAYTNRFISTSR